jgi:hypothetical protein
VSATAATKIDTNGSHDALDRTRSWHVADDSLSHRQDRSDTLALRNASASPSLRRCQTPTRSTTAIAVATTAPRLTTANNYNEIAESYRGRWERCLKHLRSLCPHSRARDIAASSITVSIAPPLLIRPSPYSDVRETRTPSHKKWPCLPRKSCHGELQPN